MQITTQVISEFREDYPEFEDTARYTDALVRKLLTEADHETGQRWGQYDDTEQSLKQRGMFAFAAHMLVMRTAAQQVSKAGGVASVVAQVSSKRVADESVSYAIATPDYATAIANGSLGNTVYGQEFMRLRSRIIGPLMV